LINRKIFIILLITSLISVVADAQPRQGQPAAEIALPSVSGDTIRLSSLKGKVGLAAVPIKNSPGFIPNIKRKDLKY
jgi:hypothetical protein